MLLWNGDLFQGLQGQSHGFQPQSKSQSHCRSAGYSQTVVVDENVTGYLANQVVTVNLNNGAHGTVQANESGTITKGSVVQVVNNGDGTFTAGEQTVSAVLGGISNAGDTYEPGEVVFIALTVVITSQPDRRRLHNMTSPLPTLAKITVNL